MNSIHEIVCFFSTLSGFYIIERDNKNKKMSGLSLVGILLGEGLIAVIILTFIAIAIYYLKILLIPHQFNRYTLIYFFLSFGFSIFPVGFLGISPKKTFLGLLYFGRPSQY